MIRCLGNVRGLKEACQMKSKADDTEMMNVECARHSCFPSACALLLGMCVVDRGTELFFGTV